MKTEFDRDCVKLEHDLNPYFAEIKSIKSKSDFLTSKIYNKTKDELDRIIDGLEWDNTVQNGENKDIIRVTAWNIERGKQFEGILHYLKNDPVLKESDILLLTETDIGMARSGNRNVPAELAKALKMNYCFATSWISLSKGDVGEQSHDQENTLSLHGTSILSKFKFKSAASIKLPMNKDVFHSKEKRIGDRKGLICKICINGNTYDFACTHLSVNAAPKHRAGQMKQILRSLTDSDSAGKLVGGDLNSSTFNLHNRLLWAGSLLYKILFLGFNKTIHHYMTPDRKFEKPLFEVFKEFGFDYNNYNDRNKGTLYYDVNDEALASKTLDIAPKFVVRWVKKKLEPWNGSVPLRLDWLAGKGFAIVDKTAGKYGPPSVIENLKWNGSPLSDHNPITADLRI